MDWDSLIHIDLQMLAFFNGSDSLFMDGMMTTFTNGFTWIPLYVGLILLVVKNNESMAQVFTTIGAGLLCILLADGLADGIIKPLVQRPRPLNDPAFGYMIDTVEGCSDNSYSFFSAHAANTFSLALFFCLLVRNKVFSCFMIGWSLLNCYTRLYLGMHYPSDILVGLAWGAVVGSGVYALYRLVCQQYFPKQRYVSSQYTRTGYSLSTINVCLCLLVATLFYGVLKAVFVLV